MPKQRLLEARFDFSGGRNSTANPDELRANELVDCTNARCDKTKRIIKRTGSRRMHTTAIGSGAPVRGLGQWDSPSGAQVVAISNGRLYHKLTDYGEFTEVIPAVGDEFSTSLPTFMAPYRAATSGAPLRLYLASDGKYYRFDGTTLTRIVAAGTPATDRLAPYHTRMFVRDKNFVKHGFWSKVGDAEVFTVGGPADGGSALVGLLTGESISGLSVIGRSLLFLAEDSIARLSGTSSDEISIAQDTEGISTDIGIVGPLAWHNTEQVVALLADRGPYMAVEAGVQPVGQNVEQDFDALDRVNLANSIVSHHHGREEIWYIVTRGADGGNNKSVFVYNYRSFSWSGPFVYPFAMTVSTHYEDSAGDEFIIAGSTDGFVRHLDFGAKDDILADASGGSTYTMTVEVPPIFFEAGPGMVKSAYRVDLQADLEVGHALNIGLAADGGAFTNFAVAASTGTGIKPYPTGVTKQGARLSLRFTDASATIPIINGFVLEAHHMNRYV